MSDTSHTPPDAASELPDPGYDAIHDIPASVLDDLAELRDAAQDGSLRLLEWREKHAQTLVGYELPPTAVLTELSKGARDAFFKTSSRRSGRPDSAVSTVADNTHWERVFDHINGLIGPPNDDEIRRDFRTRPARARAIAARETDREMREHILRHADEDENRLRAWVIEIDGVIREPRTGLPAPLIDAHRQTEHRELGSVPVSIREATAQAWLNASVEERAEAKPFSSATMTDSDAKLTAAMASAGRVVTAEFIAYARNDDSDIGRAIDSAWGSGELRQLMARFLDSDGL